MKSVQARLTPSVQTPAQARVNDLGAIAEVITAGLGGHRVAEPAQPATPP